MANTIIDGQNNGSVVVFENGEDANSVITGFTIMNGEADEGGGIYCENSSPIISKNVIISCSANYHGGGGIFCANSVPKIVGNTIRDCFGSFGGGIYSYESSPNIKNNEIFDNIALYGGGGIFCYDGTPTINSNKIMYNYNSGVYSYESAPYISSNVIAGNEGFLSGGIACDANSAAMIRNNTIVENWGQSSGGIGLDAGSTTTVTNCILWDNFTDTNENQISLFYDEYFAKPTILTIDYSDVEGGQDGVYIDDIDNCTLNWGLDNISADPCFVDSGYWDSNDLWVEGDYHLQLDSPCIDGGDPDYIPEDGETDIDGDHRGIGGRVDIGADEYRDNYILVPDEYPTIQAAIDTAFDNDTVVVSLGTYTGDGNRDIDFKGKPITVRSTNPDDPNVVAATIIDCNGTQSDPHRGFYFHSQEDAASVLKGLNIINGYAPLEELGGYMYSIGGAILCLENSSPTISKCMFVGNMAENGLGGGVYNDSNSSPGLTSCMFAGNFADAGGGIFNYSTNPNLVNCIFSGNWAVDGGGIFNQYSSPVLVNCTFSGNHGEGTVGGMYNYDNSSPTLINSILWGNSDSYGTSESAQIYTESGDPNVSFTCVQDDNPSDSTIYPGIGNIDDDPAFERNPDDGDDGWGVGDNDDFGDLHLQSGSPCIDVGDNNGVLPTVTTDFDGNPRIFNSVVDMGVYECVDPQYLTGSDGAVTLVELASHWLGYDESVDIAPAPNGDGIVNFLDFAVLAENWMK